MILTKHGKVLTVFSFLRLKSPDIAWYQWVYPTILFIILYVGVWIVGDRYFVFDFEKMLADINALMGILVGFYIAALAAVSSFTNETLDQVMKGRPPTLISRRQGNDIKETLTRRRFLTILFGYCAVISIFIYIFGVLGLHVQLVEPVDIWLERAIDIGRLIAWAVYVWVICSLLVVTLLGLHYLVERMHRA